MDLGWILIVVLFWAILFVATIVFSRRVLRVPTESELEAEHAPHEGVPSAVH